MEEKIKLVLVKDILLVKPLQERLGEEYYIVLVTQEIEKVIEIYEL